MVTEKELIKRCCKNDPRAQQELYEKYAPKMYGVCLRYACNKEIAQDLMHDGFITVFSKISSFRGEGSFEGWLRRIFVNTALGYLRKTDIVGHAAEIETAGQFGSAEATAVEQMTEAELLRCIAKLPDGYPVPHQGGATLLAELPTGPAGQGLPRRRGHVVEAAEGLIDASLRHPVKLTLNWDCRAPS